MSHRRPAGKLIGSRTKFESVLKRIYCMECGAMRDCRRVGRSAEYTLEPCGHKRVLMSSERGVENDAENERC
jgi:hypothetical protein